MKKSKFVFAITLALSVLFSSCAYIDEMQAVKSIKNVDEGVYFLEFEGDYGLDDYLSSGGGKSVDDLVGFISTSLKKGSWNGSTKKSESQVKISLGDFGCASISAANTEDCGGMIFGRNYDWNDCSIMIVHTKPKNGYESISTCCLSHLGLDRDWQPSNKFSADAIALGIIYVPMDGMNEKGLYIADLMAGDREQTAQERGKTSVTTTDAIRLVLDRAATVDEAIAILENHDMHSVIGAAHHFAISDNTGKSVVVEWAENQMYVTETKILTNHYTSDSPKKDDGTNPQTDNSRLRFNELKRIGEENNYQMNEVQIRDALKTIRANQYSVSGEELTAWSAVFEPNAKKIVYYFRENYDKPIVVEF